MMVMEQMQDTSEYTLIQTILGFNKVLISKERRQEIYLGTLSHCLPTEVLLQ